MSERNSNSPSRGSDPSMMPTPTILHIPEASKDASTTASGVVSNTSSRRNIDVWLDAPDESAKVIADPVSSPQNPDLDRQVRELLRERSHAGRKKKQSIDPKAKKKGLMRVAIRIKLEFKET